MEQPITRGALLASVIKAHPEMTEAEIAAAIEMNLAAERGTTAAEWANLYGKLSNATMNFANSTIPLIASLNMQLRQVEAERDALASWQCQTCGARFADAVPPGSADGVRQCSACVQFEVLVTKRAEAEARALIASKAYDEQQSSYRDLEAHYSEAANQRQAGEHRLAVLTTTIIKTYMGMFPTWEYISPEQALEVIKREYLTLAAAQAAKSE